MTAPNVDPVATAIVNSTAPAAVAQNAAANSETVPAFIHSLSELKEKSPKVYNAMMQGIGWSICSDIKHTMDGYLKRKKERERTS